MTITPFLVKMEDGFPGVENVLSFHLNTSEIGQSLRGSGTGSLI